MHIWNYFKTFYTPNIIYIIKKMCEKTRGDVFSLGVKCNKQCDKIIYVLVSNENTNQYDNTNMVIIYRQ